MKYKIITTAIGCLLFSFKICAWNAVGHRLVAQIAEDHLNLESKKRFNQYNDAMNKVYKPLNFVNASVWLDTLRYQDIHWYNSMHYVDLPFSDDGSPLPSIPEINAVWAVQKAKVLLQNTYAKDFDKGIALRILLHVVGDLHQPLHTATQVSADMPKGDRGGNLLVLDKNSIAKNLHAYWDKGGGFLVTKHQYTDDELKNIATMIEKNWPCAANPSLDPAEWAKEAHQLAVDNAYHQLARRQKPSPRYQRLVNTISEQQIARAGCRLALLLNTMNE